eukprot:4794650-Amphidinium_carterae.1
MQISLKEEFVSNEGRAARNGFVDSISVDALPVTEAGLPRMAAPHAQVAVTLRSIHGGTQAAGAQPLNRGGATVPDGTTDGAKLK